jgi:hypothetical protein
MECTAACMRIDPLYISTAREVLGYEWDLCG